MSRTAPPLPPASTTPSDSRDLFELAERSASLASYVWHLPEGPAEWSPELFRLLGLDPEQHQANVELFLSCVHPEDVGKMPRVIEDLLAGTRSAGAEHYRLRRPDGETRDVISRWSVLRNEDGAPKCLFGTLFDITDALLQNDRLSRALTELARAQRLANVGSWYWDLRTDCIEWSAQLFRILGYDDSVVPSRENWLARIHPDDVARFAPSGDCASGTLPPEEFRIVRPDGEVRWVYVETETTHDAAGSPMQSRGVVLDVTERRHLEERLRDSLRMEAVGRLAGGVAHDFNNLLTIVQSNVDRLRRGPDALCLDHIEQAVRTASNLTQRLLTFSRKAVLQPRLLDLNRVVADVLLLLRDVLPRQVQVDFRPAADLPPVHMDESQVHQVLLNLVTNARDAMEGRGLLTIETRRSPASGLVRAAPGTARDQATLLVRDTGQGMDAAVRARIFEPFFTTKGAGGGTGLGLATVFGIVTQSGGRVEVNSEPGRGSCFQVHFPAADVSDQPNRTPSTAPHSSSVRVLLVEDNDLVREPITFLLREAGYDVQVAANAAEAREVWKRHAGCFDVLMTDIIMPGDSGTALARDLRSECDELRVLYMTGYVDSSAPELDGRTEILQKPFRLSVPLEALQRLMASA